MDDTGTTDEGAPAPASPDEVGTSARASWLTPLVAGIVLVVLAWAGVAATNHRSVPPAPGPAAPGGGATTTMAPGGDDPVARGKKIFRGTCVACHASDAKGLPGLGKNLHDNEFVQSTTDDELVAFIETGRPADDPQNTTGVAMPPKGGNPALTESDLRDVVAFLRTLQ